MPEASAIASTEAPWKPRSANARSAASSICRSRICRGTLRVPPRVREFTVRFGAIADILPIVNLTGGNFGRIYDVPKHLTSLCAALVAALIVPASAAAQAGEKADPAGGAAIGEVIL